MFDRIEMNIVEVSSIVLLVTNGVFPEAPLPNAPFAAHPAADAEGFRRVNGFGKSHLDRLPTAGEIHVAFGEGPEGVHMVGQHHPRIDVERHQMPNSTNGCAQQSYIVDEQIAAAIEQAAWTAAERRTKKQKAGERW